MAVGRCLSLTLGFFGTRFRNLFFVGSLCGVCSVVVFGYGGVTVKCAFNVACLVLREPLGNRCCFSDVI
jgi:hypothetical protein